MLAVVARYEAVLRKLSSGGRATQPYREPPPKKGLSPGSKAIRMRA